MPSVGSGCVRVDKQGGPVLAQLHHDCIGLHMPDQVADVLARYLQALTNESYGHQFRHTCSGLDVVHVCSCFVQADNTVANYGEIWS